MKLHTYFTITSQSLIAVPSVEVEMDANGTPIFYATSASTNVLANSRRDVLVNSLGGHHSQFPVNPPLLWRVFLW